MQLPGGLHLTLLVAHFTQLDVDLGDLGLGEHVGHQSLAAWCIFVFIHFDVNCIDRIDRDDAQ